MLFSRRWLEQYVELPVPTGLVAERLTFAGFTVDSVRRWQEDGGAAAASGAAVSSAEASATADTSDASDTSGTSDTVDDVLDVDVTTNRPDCMNHLGLARELAVLFDRPLVPPPALAAGAAPAAAAVPSEMPAILAVEVEDPADCPRFVARAAAGITVGPSPRWLVRRLEAIGLRSINNVVDVTNFVLWETGQPLHAYDLDRLAGPRLVVRRARPGEELVTLDGAQRRLDPEILVIADAERPVGLAGVMGGRDSEVSDGTRRIVVESAHFDRRGVRRTAKRLGMHTDASHRFERGADLEACRAAADRAVALIVEVAGGTAVAGALDRRAAPPPPLAGRLDLARLDAFAGARLPAADVERWLTGLGFGMTRLPPREETSAAWEVTVPSWRRFDFAPRADGRVYEADLFEEAIRIFGFANIAAALPALPGSDGPSTERQRVRRRVRRCLAGLGFAEAINFAFDDPAAAAGLPNLRPGLPPLRLVNPLSERWSAMRQTLLGNLLDSARFNLRRGAAAVRLFEIGTVFFPRPAGKDGPAATLPLPDEDEHVALVCGGRVGLPWDREVALDFFDLKGAVEALAAALGVRLQARPAALPGLLAGSAAELLGEGGAVAGLLGQIEAAAGLPLFACELRLAALVCPEGGGELRALALPSRLPGVGADLTLTHSLGVSWSDLEAAIEASRPPDLVGWALKNRYQGEGVPGGAVNTTIAFYYNAGDRSLTQDEVNARQRALADELNRRFGAGG
jgi:phenylalanyl-tRNA synthetase beta chain